MEKIRTRFALSPTGYMHIGNLRTALYAYLIAKKAGGTFILRIEDTDQKRYVADAVDIIYSTLREAGLFWDEGPDIGGPCAPYVQSARMKDYLVYAKQLVERGAAYYCFCTKEELEARCGADTDGVSKYDRHCAALSAAECEARIAAGAPYVIRQKMPNTGETVFADLVYGDITVDNAELEDQILIKSDGMPTYNFANVVDDHAMGITHVVRGNEYLSSTPKYNLLYQAFGWPVPQYIHCSQIMKDEHQKLSKRNGDASYQDLVAKGYLAEAVLNYIALLGWSPKGEREIFSLAEMTEAFDISGISKSPAIFDPDKMRFINAEYIRALSPQEYQKHALPYIQSAVSRDIDTAVLCQALQPRTEVFSELPEKLGFIDILPAYGNELFENKKMKTDAATAKEALLMTRPVLAALDDYSTESIHTALFALIERAGVKNGWILWPLRVALCGVPVSPGGGVELAAILGKDETLRRIDSALAQL